MNAGPLPRRIRRDADEAPADIITAAERASLLLVIVTCITIRSTVGSHHRSLRPAHLPSWYCTVVGRFVDNPPSIDPSSESPARPTRARAEKKCAKAPRTAT